MTKETPGLIEFNRSGHTVFYRSVGNSKSTLHGYDRPESFKPAPEHEGCPVLDIRAAVETAQGAAWVFNGPMVDPDLKPGAVNAMQDPGWLGQALAAGSQEFAAMLLLHGAHDPAKGAGPLDNVSVVEFVAGWLRHGARAGVIKNGAIVWHAPELVLEG